MLCSGAINTVLSRGRVSGAANHPVNRYTRPGDLCGLMQLFSGDGQLFTYVADSHGLDSAGSGDGAGDRKVVTLAVPIAALQKLMCSEPSFMSWMFRHLMAKLSPLVFMLDWSLEWVHVNATERLIQVRQSHQISRAPPFPRPLP